MTTMSREELIRQEMEASEKYHEEHGDDMPEGTPAPTHPNRPGTPVSVRLPDARIAEIKELADRLDVPQSALVRGWILEGLNRSHASEAEPVEKAMEYAVGKMNADFDRLLQLLKASSRTIA